MLCRVRVILSWGTALRAADGGRNPGRGSPGSVRSGSDRKAPAPEALQTVAGGKRRAATAGGEARRAATGRKDEPIPPRRGGRREWQKGRRTRSPMEDTDRKTDGERRLILRHLLPPLPGRDARDASITVAAHRAWPRAVAARCLPPATFSRASGASPRSSAAVETRINTGGFLEAAGTARTVGWTGAVEDGEGSAGKDRKSRHRKLVFTRRRGARSPTSEIEKFSATFLRVSAPSASNRFPCQDSRSFSADPSPSSTAHTCPPTPRGGACPERSRRGGSG
jgi:hypothetical protein